MGRWVVCLLLEHGTDIEAKDNNSKSALQKVAGRGRDKVVESLQDHGVKKKNLVVFSTSVLYVSNMSLHRSPPHAGRSQ